MAALMPQHPARAILIRLEGQGERALHERVYQQCWKPFGGRQQICCEQIEITASDAALADLPSLLLPLEVADLPVILWCRSARLVGTPELRDIARIATKVVLDSAAIPDGPEAIRRFAEAMGRGVVLGDLAWTRITRWRETLSRVFENRDTLAGLAQLGSVHVKYGPGFETAAWYFAAWVHNALEDAGVKVSVAVSAGAPTLRLELAGKDFQLTLARQEDRLVTTMNGQQECTNLPLITDYLLLREELGIVGRDAVFERTLKAAAGLALPSWTEPK
jgi:glucose-6-phosphate dehydrogenase assembly protein OpcA